MGKADIGDVSARRRRREAELIAQEQEPSREQACSKCHGVGWCPTTTCQCGACIPQHVCERCLGTGAEPSA